MKLDTDASPVAGDPQLPRHGSAARPSQAAATRETLRESVNRALDHYFSQMEGETITELYQMVLAEVEAPLLQAVMRNTRSNQTRAAEMLGLNRGTLRKKLKQYGML